MRITDLLRTIDVFKQLSSDDLEEVAGRMRERDLRTGETLCRAGEAVEAMCVVVGGSFDLVPARADDRALPSRRLGPGDSLGEVGLISGEPHSASVVCVADSRVLELDKDDFEALIASRPRLMRTMLAAVSRRAVQANRQLLTEQPSGMQAASHGYVCALFSPRGGSGKTTLSTRLAIRLAQLMPQRVALLDLDLFFDDAALQLELNPGTSLASVAADRLPQLDPHILNHYLCEHPSSLRVLIGATSPEQGELVTATHVRAALGTLRRQFLVILVDCGSTFGEPTLAALETADRVLVVCTPELATLRDLRDCQRLFGQALHLDKSRVAYLLNHPLPSVGLTRAQFESALEERMAAEIPHGGELASKPAFARAIDQLAGELRVLAATGADSSGATESVDTPHATSVGNRLRRFLRGANAA